MKPSSGTVSFVNVSMAYIQDLSITKRLVELAENGTKVFVQQSAKNMKDNFCSQAVEKLFTDNKKNPNFIWTPKNLGEWNLYHPKTLQVTHINDEGAPQHFLMQGS